MSIPIQLQLFDAFLGTQESIHSIILPDIFSSGGSKNVYIDKYARVKKIQGYSKQTAAAITTNTGGSASMVRALAPYRATSGGSITRHVMLALDDQVNEFEIWYSTDSGATFTFIQDFGAGSINSIPDFSQFGDSLYITNGVVAPRKWNGTAISTAGRTQSPTVTSAAGAAGNLKGTYKWKLVSMKAGVRQAGSVASTSINLDDEIGSLTWTADADTDVDGYELYRTSATGSVYYFVTFIDGRTTAAYSDNTSDFEILESRILQEHGDAPPTVHFCEPHKQRMWWGRTSANPTRAYWSDPGLPEDVLSDNFLDFSDGETIGDVLTGMYGNIEGKMVAFTERAVWTVSGSGEVIGDIVDWTRVKTNAAIGSVSHKTAIKIPGGAKYSDQEGKTQTTNVVTLAYLTPYADIRIFDGDNDVIISHPVKTTLSAMNYGSRAKAYAVPNSERGEIAWIFPSGSATEPSQAVVWNYRWGVWYLRDWAFACAVEIETSSDASLLLGGSSSTTTGAYVYELLDSNGFDGADIEAIWMTKTLYGITPQGQPAISNQKRFRWLDLLFQTEQTADLTIEWLSGFSPDDGAAVSSKIVSPAAESLVSGDGSTILTGDGSEILVSQQSTGLRVKLKNSQGKYLHDQGIRLRIKDDAQNGSWALEAMTLAYQIFPGLQRRMQ